MLVAWRPYFVRRNFLPDASSLTKIDDINNRKVRQEKTYREKLHG